MMRVTGLIAAAWLSIFAAAAAAQTTVPFGTSGHDASQPVEVTSERLDLDQGAGSAIFSGTVRVGQGALRMAADKVQVFYDPKAQSGTGPIQRLIAAGNVTLTNGTEAAEADSATYEVGSGKVDMQGNVLLTQGSNALSGDRLAIDLNANSARMDGRVRTLFVPQSPNQPGPQPGTASKP
ncbi:lipopolysaccharide export system protein LptA [Amaricoccus macauensis]|uniref:Lipopolysaccharide export system protein LptA n=1 Tax=Amaricoccus macauensis TaxID=57001 RepID=A0A840SQL0_9RHOB|nr:lipopolysaccharide export system protein LptA [Amaricoccus macauensis]